MLNKEEETIIKSLLLELGYTGKVTPFIVGNMLTPQFRETVYNLEISPLWTVGGYITAHSACMPKLNMIYEYILYYLNKNRGNEQIIKMKERLINLIKGEFSV